MAAPNTKCVKESIIMENRERRKMVNGKKQILDIGY
jgi:hypothetical protein